MASSSMRAACADRPDHLELRDLPIPEPAAGELRVRLEACGICGSDLHFRSGGMLPPGHTPGHEMAGRVDALGEGTSGPAVGTRVAIEPMRSCGSCRECLAGRNSACRQFQLNGLHLPGGFADYVVVPAAAAFAVIEEASPAVAALAEPLAVAVHALRRGGFEAGQRVLVLGCGAVGLTTLIAARAAKAGEVWISARHESKPK